MTRFAAIAVYASIVSAARGIIVPIAGSAKCAWNMSVPVATDALSALMFAPSAAKSVQTVPRKTSAADATSVRIVQAVTETFAITAKPARCALNLSVSAVEGARSV